MHFAIAESHDSAAGPRLQYNYTSTRARVQTGCMLMVGFCRDRPVLRVMNGEDDPGVEVILFESHQHGELVLASQFLDHLL